MINYMAVGLACVLVGAAAAAQVEVTIDTAAGLRRISPYVYGANGHGGDEEANVTVVRSGGNRLTGYNWETNYSSAGNGWRHSSDDYLLRGVAEDRWREPGIVVSGFHEWAASLGAADVVTLQMAGYVAADNRGTVTEEEAAPSPRWHRVEFSKGAAFSLRPDTTDGVVYMDELVNLLVQKYGRAADGGVKMYSLDNEPTLWSGTHARIRPKPLTCDELIERSIALSRAVKDVDPTAQIVGGAFYGWSAYESLQAQPELTGWDKYSEQYDNWFINFYLDRMRRAEEEDGRRLLDVLDIHWYPEVRVDGVRITLDRGVLSEAMTNARIQAPRSLWDETHREESWIGQWRHPIRLLPRLQENIDRYYPGTRLAICEFDYGGGGDVSGAIAHADFLGICGRDGVYMTCHWGALRDYTLAGYKVFRNYDGNRSAFGDTSVRAETSDPVNSSVYASLDDAGRLHIILINKNLEQSVAFNIGVTHGVALTTAEAYVVDSSGPQVGRLAPVTEITANRLTFTAAPLSVNHLVLRSEG
ncbi:MAG: glycoside hydrolase family 44 protein [Candidatus Brocadiae bacterium]|nr:glycoside hydrolase family 44 protein [Candidatus Brocadiia bacterium]